MSYADMLESQGTRREAFGRTFEAATHSALEPWNKDGIAAVFVELHPQT